MRLLVDEDVVVEHVQPRENVHWPREQSQRHLDKWNGGEMISAGWAGEYESEVVVRKSKPANISTSLREQDRAVEELHGFLAVSFEESEHSDVIQNLRVG